MAKLGPSQHSKQTSAGNMQLLCATSLAIVCAVILSRLGMRAMTVIPVAALLPTVALCLRFVRRDLLHRVFRTMGSLAIYLSVWMTFAYLRGMADETKLAGPMHDKVWRFERWLFRGKLLNARIQDRFLDALQAEIQDFALTGVYFSFFFIPLAVCVFLGWSSAELVRQFLGAAVIILGAGLLIHLLMPTNPPWMPPSVTGDMSSVPANHVHRVTAMALGDSSAATIDADQNPLAAMPSIHMAFTLLMLIVSTRFGRPWQVSAIGYTALMAFTLIYLGEHYLIDEIAGGALTLGAWFAASAILRRWDSFIRGILCVPSMYATFLRRI